MEEQKNFAPAFKLYEASAKDEYREAFWYIWFSNGYAYASNAHIMVRADISRISTFTDEEIAMLDGKKIKADLFKKLLKHECVDIREDGFYAQEENKKTIYLFDTNDSIKMPKFDEILSNGIEGTKHGTPLTEIGISAVEFTKLTKAMGAEGVLFSKLALRFSTPNKAMIVERCSEETQSIVGLIMLVLLD